MNEPLHLYSYWRSSAAYRVRIGLNLKELTYTTVPVHLLQDGGQQHHPSYQRLNPQELVPTLVHGERHLTQSLAILEYIDECFPQPALLPHEVHQRQQVRALAQLVACDIHPLNNLRVLQYVEREWAQPAPAREQWVRHWMAQGFSAFEALLAQQARPGDFCFGNQPTLADCCLIPQLYNAHRFAVSLQPFPLIQRIEANCMALPAFIAAHPDQQPDAPAATQ